MSLYSSLTQVLAPFAAKIKGIQTGYDGTTYSSPGEAVRTQISDLHVLIGDEPGTSIQGEAVSYDGTESGLTATTVQAAIDENAANLSNTNERLDNMDRRVDFTINGSESSTAFVQGSRVANTYSEVVENPNRCTSANIFYVKKGDGFRVSCETEGVKYAVAGKYTSGSTWDSGWKTGDYGVDEVADDIAIFVNVATSDGNTPITPNDFTATMTQTDNTSELHDAYQDINALHKDTSALQELIYDFHSLVNYNFDTSCDYGSSGQTSSGTGVGIIRDKTQIVLSGGGVNSAATIKLNDTVERTISPSTIRGWTPSVLFKTGYTYKIKSVWTNGTITGAEDVKVPTVSAYRAGTSSSAGTYEYSEDSKTFVRTVVGDGVLYNIALYIPAYYVFTDAELTVTIEEIASYDIKDQYIAEMIDTIQKVRNEADSPALVFPWVTDIHRYVAGVQTFDDMIDNIKAFAEHVKCDFVLNSGDTIQGDKSQAVSLGYAYDCIAAFKNIGVALMYCEGNHDNNPYISSGALTFTLKQVYSGFFSATKGVSFNPNENGTDYYFDFNGLDVRFISLNSCNSELSTNYAYGASTATWLANALDTEKKVIVVAHVSPIKEHVWNNNSPINSASISTALSDFVSRGGKLILLTGHSHVDAEFIEPYCEVTSVCQKFEKADVSTTQYEAITGKINGIRNPDRTEGTETADAWTVAVYKPMSNELSLIRFGAGVDRYIHCNPITPGTVTTKLSGTIAWKTSDANVATVANGVVTGVASGKCAIIAEDENGNFEYWIVDVT